MVYCGKPSKGCQMCRTRRIKCDETKPTCNQCAKARRQCPGYRDEFDILLRDENRAAERRALKASDKSLRKSKDNKPPKPPSSSELPDTNKNKQLVLSPPPPSIITPSLTIPTQDLATCHFISNFVLLPPQQEEHSARGFMDFLIPLLNTPHQTDNNNNNNNNNNHLQHAFQACALASLGTRSPSVGQETPLHAASLEYMKALRSTQSALRSPELCTSDSVLAAVLLLSMFENITAKQPNGCAWGSHIQGAVQIVKARGKKQLKTKTGLQLFIAVRTQLIIQALTSSTPPPLGADWWTPPTASLDPHAAHCQRLNLLTAQVRSEVVSAMSSSPSITDTASQTQTIRSLLLRAQDLDSQLETWLNTLPDSFRPKTSTYISDPPPSSSGARIDYGRLEVYPGRVDAYQDIWTASVVNMGRTTRLVLQSLIVRCAAWCVSPVDYRSTAEFVRAKRVCEGVIGDVLAGVGFCLGFLGGGGKGEGKVLGGYFLTWPLSCVMGQDYASDSQRQYAIGRLKYIGDELGIRYSHILAQFQVRVPSMLIRRDGLLAKPYPMAHDFQRLLGAAREGPPLLSGYQLNPLQQREVMVREEKERGKDELLKKAAGGAKDDEVVSAVKKMLVV
ncbi:hypothetical protein QBC44DRAFT_358970 [Cladorrhinum sp. PSN332]|nr:hypothetical protein QBC44DRAFT_358970 [Cladorrhinum sp. PSN332]